MEKSVRGISFPFRLSNKGGVLLSEATLQDVAHIEESIEQILCTNKGERIMNYEFGADLNTEIFMPQDSSLRALTRYNIKEALTQQEPRINVTEENINVYVENNNLMVEIKYTLVDFPNLGLLKTLINLGGVEFEN